MADLAYFDSGKPFLELLFNLDTISPKTDAHAQRIRKSRAQYATFLVDFAEDEPQFAADLIPFVSKLDILPAIRVKLVTRLKTIAERDHTLENHFIQALRLLAQEKAKLGEDPSLELATAAKMEKNLYDNEVNQVMGAFL